MRRHPGRFQFRFLFLGWMGLLIGCGGEPPSQPEPPGGTHPHLTLTGRPSAVLIQVIGAGVLGFTGTTEFSHSMAQGDTLTLYLAGTTLDGAVGTLELTTATSASQLQLRVIEAADASNALMAAGSVTATARAVP